MAGEGEFDRDMAKMASLFDTVKHQYDLYFAGARTDPPSQEYQDLERMVRRYNSGTLAKLNQQFRFATFSNKFALYSEQWNKWLRARQDGLVADPRISGAIRRAKKTMQNLERGGKKEPKAEKKVATETAPPAEQEVAAAAPTNGGRASRKLFDEFVSAMIQGNQIPQWDFPAFEAHIAKQKEAILQKYKGKDVVFTVQNLDGKVSLKAKVVK